MSDTNLTVRQLGDFETMGSYIYEFTITSSQSVQLTSGETCKILFVFFDSKLQAGDLDYPNPVIMTYVYTATSNVDLSVTPISIGTYTTINDDLGTNLPSAATIYFNIH